jgi:hypothetical protein
MHSACDENLLSSHMAYSALACLNCFAVLQPHPGTALACLLVDLMYGKVLKCCGETPAE